MVTAFWVTRRVDFIDAPSALAIDTGFPEVAGCNRRSCQSGSDQNSPEKHVWRAKIILATADGLGTAEIMRRSGKSKPSLWHWRERFMTDGVDGLLRDKTRPSRIPPWEQTIIDRGIALTATEPPHQATHWTAAAMAAAVAISISSVQRVWRGRAHKAAAPAPRNCRPARPECA